jgi:sec-independent protein translocase protein TatA
MLAVGIGPIGPFEAMIILAVVILIFGVGKVSDLGGALGKSVREFRRNVRDTDEPDKPASTNNAPTAGAPQVAPARFCSNCSAQLAGDEKSCAKCGAPVQAAVN